MDTSGVKDEIRKLFASQSLAVLATDMDGRPYTSLVAFVESEDLSCLVFVTDRETRKYANISANPRVSLLIDNRSHRPSDFKDAIAVTVLGEAHEVDGEDERSLRELYILKHPHMTGFVSSPTASLLLVQVEEYLMVSGLTNVIKTAPSDW